MRLPLHRTLALVAVGAAAGSLLRYLASLAAPYTPGVVVWPWATFAVNIVGCALMGVFLGRVSVAERVPPQATPLIATGFLGGLTTFSTFAMDIVLGSRAGAFWWAVAYTIVSVGLGWLAVRLGWNLAGRRSR